MQFKLSQTGKNDGSRFLSDTNGKEIKVIKFNSRLFGILCAALLFAVAIPATALTGEHADMSVSSGSVQWSPHAAHDRIVLTISGGGHWMSMTFEDGAFPVFQPFDKSGNQLPDGQYTWEMSFLPRPEDINTEEFASERMSADHIEYSRHPERVVQSGSVRILNGSFVDPEGAIEPAPEGSTRGTGGNRSASGPGSGGGPGGGGVTRDQVIADDLIVDGSACIGFDCVNGESFGFDTIRLKENNLRIKFEDTSVASSFPRNDWQLTANASANGGAEKFSIEDISGGRTPFTVEANAPSHSLYVDDGGRIGNGTSTPSTEIHTIDGDTPTLRLQQDGSSGFAPQTWDVAGNETNFFIRDVTNGSTLPFRIRPGAPTSSIFIDVDGDVGLGTASPDASLHVTENDGVKVRVEETNTDAANDVMLELESAGGAPIIQFISTFNTWSFTAGNLFSIANPTGVGTELTLDVNGNMTVTGSVTAPGGHLPDYVFEPDYELMPLEDLASFVKENKHLPNVPSLDDMKKSGGMINMNEMQNALLEKVEELTLYVLSQNEEIAELREELAAVKAEDIE